MVESRRSERKRSSGDQPKVMLTMGEACRLLNVHSNTLRRWTATGTIRAYRIGLGAHRRYKQEDIVALLVEQDRFSESNVSD